MHGVCVCVCTSACIHTLVASLSDPTLDTPGLSHTWKLVKGEGGVVVISLIQETQQVLSIRYIIVLMSPQNTPSWRPQVKVEFVLVQLLHFAYTRLHLAS